MDDDPITDLMIHDAQESYALGIWRASRNMALSASGWIIAVAPLMGCASQTADSARSTAIESLSPPREFAGASRAGVANQPASDDWLASFGDETLRSLVAEAILNNPDLRASAARRDEAAARVRVARSLLMPRIDARGRAQRADSGSGSDSTLSAEAVISWEADLWGRIRAGERAQREDALSVALEDEYLRQSLAALVAQAWFNAIASRMQIAIDEDRVEIESETSLIAGSRARVGAGTLLDDEVAQANLSFARSALESSRQAFEESTRALELLLGRYPAAELAVASDIPALPAAPGVGLSTDILERRPDLVAADRRVAAAFYRLEAERATRLPRLTISASGGTLFDPSQTIWSIAADLLAPIFTAGEIEAQIDIASAQQQEALAQYISVALNAYREVESALASEHYLRTRLDGIEHAAERLSSASRIASERYQAGVISIFDLTSVRRDFYAARSQRVALETERLNSRVALHLAIGGSFDSPDARAARAAPEPGPLHAERR